MKNTILDILYRPITVRPVYPIFAVFIVEGCSFDCLCYGRVRLAIINLLPSLNTQFQINVCFYNFQNSFCKIESIITLLKCSVVY